jgi:WD40 repeat protein
MIPEGHTDYIYSATYSPDGNKLLTASGDKTAKLWDIKSGKLLHSFQGHTDVVRSANFSPDGLSIVTGSDDNTSIEWDTQTGKLLYDFKDKAEVRSVVYSPDGKKIATGNDNYTVNVWDAQTNKLIYVIKGGDPVFSPDGKRIVTNESNYNVSLWDSEKGKLLLRLKGHTDAVFSNTFSPDGKNIVSASRDNTAKVWEVQTGKLLNTLTGHTDWVWTARFSPDGKSIVTASRDNTAKVWDALTGKILYPLAGHKDEVTSATFSPDGKSILTSDFSFSLIWDSKDGKLLHSMIGGNAAYSPNGKTFVTNGHNISKIWDSYSWKLIRVFEGHTSYVYSVAFSPDKTKILAVSEDSRGILFDLKSGEILTILNDISYGNAIFSPNGKIIAAASSKFALKLWDTQSGRLLDSLLGHTDDIWSISFSTDGGKIATASYDKTAKIWDVKSCKLICNLVGHTDMVLSAYFSPDGNYIVTDSKDYTAKIWDAQSGKLLFSLDNNNIQFNPNSFSPDSKRILTGSDDWMAAILDVKSGDLITKIGKPLFDDLNSIYFSPDGNYVLTTSDNGAINILDIENKTIDILDKQSDWAWLPRFSSDGKSFVMSSDDRYAHLVDVKSGNLLQSVDLHAGTLNDINWSDSILISVFNSKITLHDLKSEKELLSFVIIDSADWVVLHPSGLFDASTGAMDKMYYVQNGEIIELNQLKERYFEPGLWDKVMGSNTEPLRNVKGFDEIKLTPLINLDIKDGILEINLQERGGGIGKFIVFINGKEAFTGNIPESESSFRGETNLKSSFLVKSHKYLYSDKENEIEVKAYNGENYIISKGEKIIYNQGISTYSDKPGLFLISVGVSDYTGNLLDLKYAAKDAEDITLALSLGAKNLFGIEKTSIIRITTNEPDRTNWPTKENIIRTFAEVAKQAKASDILVVYLSGHGINWGGQDGDFFYLTQDAYSGSADLYNDPVIRGKTTLSSLELTELIKSVSALKEVLIIDACGSGRTVENLMAKRDISSSTLRALDRMKDRTGLHIITGCAADAVSYEASRYGQGVLTYSLLEGIKGASLREEKFVDVVKLFQYSAERVPQLAIGIGGIQQPQVFSPYGESSFDIGEIRTSDKSSIPIAMAKPMFLMSSLKDKDSFDDILGIEKLVDEKLRDVSSKSAASPFIFIEAKEYPEAYRIRGAYTVGGEAVEISVNVFLGTEKAGSYNINGKKSEIASLADLIVSKAQESIK